MDICEVSEKRAELEQRILGMLRVFENLSDASVSAVSLRQALVNEVGSNRQRSRVVAVQISVSL